MCGYNALLRIVGQIQGELYASRAGGAGGAGGATRNLHVVVAEREDELGRYYEDWTRRFEEANIPNDPVFAMRSWLLPL